MNIQPAQATPQQPISPPAEPYRSTVSHPDHSQLAIVNTSTTINSNNKTAFTSPPTTGLIDSSSALIIHWFDNVCPAWSGFDSSANPIRTIAVDVWRSSVTVGSALEAMSAAFLASRDPNMRRTAMRLMRRAADYAQVELGMMRAGTHPSVRSDGMTLPTGLLFSLFGVGTTICWVDAHSLGLPFLRETRRLLARLNRQQRIKPGAVDAERLEFFNKCMTYCDMLLSVVHDDNDVVDSSPLPGDWQVDNSSLAPSLTPYMSAAATVTGPTICSTLPCGPSNIVVTAENRPHPWTGISSLASRLFAETMGLCRRVQLRSGLAAAPPPAHYLLAERLEEQLLNAEIEVPAAPDPYTPSSLWHLSDTGDARTPPSHLALIAEAYRLSSLLVFYETFPSFGYLRLRGQMALPTGVDVGGDDSGGTASLPSTPDVLWQEWITPLSLHLLRVLERIPLTSGSRVIQPLLYICASTGLRLPDTRDEPRPEVRSECDSLKVSKGRSFVLQRLTILESSLPPTPVTMAKELVRAIWRAYDASPPGSAPVHWINVMEAANLRSMFG